jgi:hypothetical protein
LSHWNVLDRLSIRGHLSSRFHAVMFFDDLDVVDDRRCSR